MKFMIPVVKKGYSNFSIGDQIHFTGVLNLYGDLRDKTNANLKIELRKSMCGSSPPCKSSECMVMMSYSMNSSPGLARQLY